ncbi:conserved hypothetical protein [Tenacibaculum litopenaei]|uniref:hypothetical protein n=1 Tax=Tenacibaculum litopenaei TaxID=396016 RepID=UPI003892E43D
MGACSKQIFNNVSEASWDQLKTAVKNQLGIVITSDSGSDSKDDFTISWNYAANQHELAIQCTDSPWYVPCSLINGKIHDLVEGILHGASKELTAML